jgi:excinuclease ABC subunit B
MVRARGGEDDSVPVRGGRGRGRGRGRQAATSRSAVFELQDLPPDDLTRLIQTLQEEMHEASKELRFEEAARLRDEISELKRELREFA